MEDFPEITRYLALLNLVAAAKEGATPKQQSMLRMVQNDMQAFDVAESVRMIRQIKGDEWRPSGRYADAIGALV